MKKLLLCVTVLTLFSLNGCIERKNSDKIKQAAAKLGAMIVWITVDDFAMSPINNVNMVGTAYVSDTIKVQTEQHQPISGSIDSEEITNWTKIIITRNPEDVKGLQRIDDVSAETSRLLN